MTLEAVDSVLAQSFQPAEIIVVDDGSDMPIKEALAAKSENITCIYIENRGVAAARNAGIKACKTEWVALLDSDDVWQSEKLQKQVDYHRENRELLISQSDEQWIRNGKRVKKPKHYKKEQGDLFAQSLKICAISPSTVLLHQAVFETVGYFDESYEVCEDYELWLRVASQFEVGLVDEELTVKRAGDWEQLSDRNLLDIWRIQAIEKNMHRFSEAQKKEALIELERKKSIVESGAKKRGRDGGVDTSVRADCL